MVHRCPPTHLDEAADEDGEADDFDDVHLEAAPDELWEAVEEARPHVEDALTPLHKPVLPLCSQQYRVSFQILHDWTF